MPQFAKDLRWTHQVAERLASATPPNAVLRWAVTEPSKAQQRETELLRRAPDRASPTVQWLDCVARGASQGRAVALTYGLGAAVPIGLMLSPQLRASAYACAVTTAVAGTGATTWAQDTALPNWRAGRALTGFVGYGIVGAAWGAARGAPPAANGATAASRQTPPPERRTWMAVVDAALAGLTVCLHGLQLYASLYPILLVSSVVVAASVVGSVLGGAVGAMRGYSVVMRDAGTARAGEGTSAGAPPPPPAAEAARSDVASASKTAVGGAAAAAPSMTPPPSPHAPLPSEAPSLQSSPQPSPELLGTTPYAADASTHVPDAASDDDSELSLNDMLTPGGGQSTYYDAPIDRFDSEFARAVRVRTDSDES